MFVIKGIEGFSLTKVEDLSLGDTFLFDDKLFVKAVEEKMMYTPETLCGIHTHGELKRLDKIVQITEKGLLIGACIPPNTLVRKVTVELNIIKE